MYDSLLILRFLLAFGGAGLAAFLLLSRGPWGFRSAGGARNAIDSVREGRWRRLHRGNCLSFLLWCVGPPSD